MSIIIVWQFRGWYDDDDDDKDDDDDDKSFLHFQWAKFGQHVFHILVHLQMFSLMIFVLVVTLCKYDF